MYPHKTNIGTRKMEWRREARIMPKERLGAMADRAVWQKVTKGGAGIRWDSAIKKYGSMLEETKIFFPAEKLVKYKTEVEEKGRKKSKVSANE